MGDGAVSWWAYLFAALSRSHDTVDTMRHFTIELLLCRGRSGVSQLRVSPFLHG